MTTVNPQAALASKAAIRKLLKLRHHRQFRADARFFILRHISALRALRSVVGGA